MSKLQKILKMVKKDLEICADLAPADPRYYAGRRDAGRRIEELILSILIADEKKAGRSVMTGDEIEALLAPLGGEEDQ